MSPRVRPLTPEEVETRRIAYALKECREAALAAAEMAALLPPGLPSITLVPIPSSTGSIEANHHLAQAIARAYGRQAHVIAALARPSPVESSCARRRRGIPGLTASDHHFVRIPKWLTLPVILVDNVVTTGATLTAAHHTLGFGIGLVFADASPTTPALRKRGFSG
jgi:predicted amidophosphoribosyltransferase